MPLLTTIQQAHADNAADAVLIARHIQNAAVIANRIAERSLSLSVDNMTAFLQSKPQAEMFGDFESHAAVGYHVNALGTILATMAGVEAVAVDTAPVSEKLARKGLVFDPATMTVSPIPQPEEPT